MSTRLKVVQFGIGPIGQSCLRTVLSKNKSIELVGAIDIDPEKVGKDVSEILGLEQKTGVIVGSDARAVLENARPDVVVHTTSSFLASMYDQLLLCAEYGANVVSSTEELSYPFDRHPEISVRLDEAAKKHGVTLLGTGVNPGYAMDALALMATGVCNEVTSIEVNREVNASLRRLPLQLKIGAGLSVEAFEEKKATGQFGHIGLVESVKLIADGLNWPIERLNETLDCVISPKKVVTPFLTVEEGQVAGIHHYAKAFIGDTCVISLDLKMFVGAEDPRDAVLVQGDPPVDLVVRGGIFGDTATVATLINGIPSVAAGPAGLATVASLPIPRAFGTKWSK
ncbi:MAG: dihydrodipicolinate reductase [Bacteroidetes bacterium]|nr:MAG: dihydrodipicolinate reductase [Bacteroidota bacterium]